MAFLCRTLFSNKSSAAFEDIFRRRGVFDELGKHLLARQQIRHRDRVHFHSPASRLRKTPTRLCIRLLPSARPQTRIQPIVIVPVFGNGDIGFRKHLIQTANLNLDFARGKYSSSLRGQCFARQNHSAARLRNLPPDQPQGLQHHRQMPFQFTLAASGKQKNLWRCVLDLELGAWNLELGKPIHHRMPHKLNAQFWHAPRIPIFLEGKNTQAEDRNPFSANS